jgi:hypothetical protein
MNDTAWGLPRQIDESESHKVDWEAWEQEVVRIGREILDTTPPDIEEARPTTNNLVLKKDEARPMGFEDALIADTWWDQEPEPTTNPPTLDVHEQDEIYCLHCESIFPAAQLKVDHMGNRCGCGSRSPDNCDGAGFGVDLYPAKARFAVGVMAQNNRDPQAARRSGYLGVTNS